MVKQGVIISAFGGTFRVAAEGEEYICTARGVFRNKDISPECGDRAEIDCTGGEYVITKIFDRKNEIVRPPLANLDQLVFVSSTVEPVPNILNLDKFTAVSEFKGISPVIVFTKTDLNDAESYAEIYDGIFPTFCIDNVTGEGIDGLKEVLKDRFSALCGNSGVGKSSLLNNLIPGIEARTGEISKKLGRGRHTTRRTDIYSLPFGGYLADTPGFASFSTDRYDIIFKDSIADCFPEFREYLGQCRYSDCSHRKEQGCVVIEALNAGKIKPSRHRSYCEMYQEAEKLKPWEIKNKR